jgi:hypothetical protein
MSNRAPGVEVRREDGMASTEEASLTTDPRLPAKDSFLKECQCDCYRFRGLSKFVINHHAIVIGTDCPSRSIAIANMVLARPNYRTKTLCSFIQFGLNYIHFTEPTPAPEPDARPRPQPRPKNPKKGSDKTTK